MRISDWSSDVCSSDLVTVAVEGMKFHHPVFVGDDVSVFAHLVRVGTTSMTIDVEAWRRARHSEESHRVTQGKFVFVAVDEARRPRSGPPIDRQSVVEGTSVSVRVDLGCRLTINK